jgi:predicted aconitase with swiveling domain
MRGGGGDGKMELKGRIIYKGTAEGEALTTTQPISFYGGVDPNTGEVIEKGHELQAKIVKGKVLVFPNGKGSTVGSYTLYRMKKNGTAPAAIVNKECETIIAVGAIISEIPCVDHIDITQIKTGTTVHIINDTVSFNKQGV